MNCTLTRVAAAAQHCGLKTRESRRQVFLRARMRAGGVPVDVCIRNISSHGMLLQAAAPPLRGTYVEIFYPRRTIVARVVWTNDRRFGVQTREWIDVNALIGDAAPSVSRSAPTSVGMSALTPSSVGPTLADVQQRREQSQRLSSVLEFGFVVAFGSAAALFAASTIHEQLAATFQNVTTHLQKAN